MGSAAQAWTAQHITSSRYHSLQPVWAPHKTNHNLLTSAERLAVSWTLIRLVHARGSRAFVRAAAGDDDLPVPSPTYLLQNVYDELDGVSALHAKLLWLVLKIPGNT